MGFVVYYFENIDRSWELCLTFISFPGPFPNQLVLNQSWSGFVQYIKYNKEIRIPWKIIIIIVIVVVVVIIIIIIITIIVIAVDVAIITNVVIILCFYHYHRHCID